MLVLRAKWVTLVDLFCQHVTKAYKKLVTTLREVLGNMHIPRVMKRKRDMHK